MLWVLYTVNVYVYYVLSIEIEVGITGRYHIDRQREEKDSVRQIPQMQTSRARGEK